MSEIPRATLAVSHLWEVVPSAASRNRLTEGLLKGENMNQAETQIFLDACDTAFLAFQHRNPDFVFSEALAREMALTLQAEGLDPRNVHHLSAAWLKVRPSPAPPHQAPVSEDAITTEARRMLASGEVT